MAKPIKRSFPGTNNSMSLALAKESMSCSGELNRAFGAEEQLYFQFFLERFDLLADRGLSNAKLFRCSGEALLFGDSREVKEITEFHAESVIDSTYYSNR